MTAKSRQQECEVAGHSVCTTVCVLQYVHYSMCTVRGREQRKLVCQCPSHFLHSYSSESWAQETVLPTMGLPTLVHQDNRPPQPYPESPLSDDSGFCWSRNPRPPSQWCISYAFSLGVRVLHTRLCRRITLSTDCLNSWMSRMALASLVLYHSFPSLVSYLYFLHLQIAVMCQIYKVSWCHKKKQKVSKASHSRCWCALH